MENGLKSEEVKVFVDMFEEAEQSSLVARELSNRCRDYVDGNQLTEEEVSELAKRGQPAIVINRIRRKINWLRGVEMQGRTDPKAFPRTPQADYDADAATQAIRYVCDNTQWDRKRSQVWDNILIEGAGGVEVIHEFKPPMKEPEIKINRYAFDRLFWDPHSSESDFGDARYKGAVVWSDMDELIEKYEDKKGEIEASIGPMDTTDDTFEDKPYYQIWSDPKRRRVRCVLLYYRKGGKWLWAKFVKGGVLESGESPYVDDMGESICPLIMQSAYVTRNNDRQSEVRDMLDPQDEVNKRRSKLLHQLNSRQTWGIKGAVDSVKVMKRELAKPDGHIEISEEAAVAAGEARIAPFNIISQADQVSGQMALMQEAKNEIDLLGANASLQGNGQGSSGREVLARQQGGMIEITPLQDELSHFTQTVFRHIWFMVRQFWTGDKWLRVTDDERNVKWVPLNQPVTLADRLGEMPQEQVVMIAREMGLHRGDPRLMQAVDVKNDVSSMDVDIILEEVPDQVTLQGETFEQLVNLATSMPGTVPPEILIEATPNMERSLKERLIERLEEQSQQRQQAEMAEIEAKQATAAAEVEQMQSETMENVAQAEKHQADAHRALMGF